MKTSHTWPDWLAPPSSKLFAQLKSIEESHERLRSAAELGFIYRNVPQGDVNAQSDQMLAAGIMKRGPDGVTVTGPVVLPREWARAYIYDVSSPHRLFRQLTASNRLAVIRLLDGFFSGIQEGDLLVPLVCLRSTIEQVAHYHHSLVSLRILPEPGNFTSNSKAVIGFRERVAKMLYGTHVNWQALANADPATVEKKMIEYVPSENRMNLTTKSIMNGIDSLDKLVPGLRASYGVLSEFAHPNVGSTFISTISCAQVRENSTGINWIERRLGLEPPQAFVAAWSGVLELAFSRIASSLSHYHTLLQDADIIAANLLCLIQATVRHMLSSQPGLIATYDPCPCGSGKNLRCCCSQVGK